MYFCLSSLCFIITPCHLSSRKQRTWDQTAWWEVAFRGCLYVTSDHSLLGFLTQHKAFSFSWLQTSCNSQFHGNIQFGSSQGIPWFWTRLHFLIGYHSRHFINKGPTFPEVFSGLPFLFLHIWIWEMHEGTWDISKLTDYVVDEGILQVPFPLHTFPW